MDQTLQYKLFNLFRTNKKMDTGKLSEFMKQEKINFDTLFNEICTMVTAFMAHGKFVEEHKPEMKFDEEQIRMGIKTEHEHTDDSTYGSLIALKIALDHLTEFPDYYTHLDEMESKISKKKNVE